jgi:hypothetical protein
VAPEHNVAVEGQEEVLANRLDSVEPPPVETLRDPQRGGPRVWGLRGHHLSLEHA